MRRFTRPLAGLDGQAALLLAGSALLAVGLALPGRAALQSPPPTVPTYPPSLPSMGNADSNGTMIAVTGIDLTGSSILYLVDTEKKQLAIYQATGGTESMQGVKLVGARRIDLDLQLEGYNDRSQYPYEELEQRFARSRAEGGTPSTK